MALAPFQNAVSLEPLLAETPQWVADLQDRLRLWLGGRLTICDAETGNLLGLGSDAPAEHPCWADDVIRVVAQRRKPEFLADQGPLSIFAIPLPADEERGVVAVGAFALRDFGQREAVGPAATLMGLSDQETLAFVDAARKWTTDNLLALAGAVQSAFFAERRASRLQKEVDDLSHSLSSTYEEISLLYGLTQNLRLSASDHELARLALEWLIDVAPAEGFALCYLPRKGEDATSDESRRPEIMTCGDWPLEEADFRAMIESLDLTIVSGPCVLNQDVTDRVEWGYEAVRQLIVAPLVEGDNIFGWLAAANHVHGGEFGTVEASLLSSVGAILGIHSGNIELYRQQAEMVTGVVRALTSAIDAKDEYTCGHSDRVARVAVRLAQQFNVDPAQLKRIYMGGLLHDIGKIGIDDSVLRKPGKLTDEEYDHIKLHPGLGHKILKDIDQLSEVVPVVLHHHENWDGTGYPARLAGETIPWEARITAVADAFDAMSSDRPYRQGMNDEKVDAIFRAGAGKQWDPAVVEAFFHAREDIRQIADRSRDSHFLDQQSWM